MSNFNLFISEFDIVKKLFKSLLKISLILFFILTYLNFISLYLLNIFSEFIINDTIDEIFLEKIFKLGNFYFIY